MHVVGTKHLKDAAARFPDAAKPIAAWRAIARESHWRTFDDVRQVFADAESAGEYVVFRIHQDRYRLVTTIHYPPATDGKLGEGHIWIRSLLTQKQFENTARWDEGDLR